MNQKLLAIMSIFLLVILNIAMADNLFPIYVRNRPSNTIIELEVNYTTDRACSNVLFSDVQNIPIDNKGAGFMLSNITSLTTTPSFICEYQDNILTAVHQWNKRNLMGDEIFFNDIVIDNLIAGEIGINGSIGLIDNSFLYLSDDKTEYIQYNTTIRGFLFGTDYHPFFVDVEGNIGMFANVGSDGGGNWSPSFDIVNEGSGTYYANIGSVESTAGGGTAGNFYIRLDSANKIEFLSGGDNNNYIIMNTTDNIPYITTVGDTDLRLDSSSNLVNISVNLNVVGNITGNASQLESIDCTQIFGSPDNDFCTDQTSVGIGIGLWDLFADSFHRLNQSRTTGENIDVNQVNSTNVNISDSLNINDVLINSVSKNGLWENVFHTDNAVESLNNLIIIMESNGTTGVHMPHFWIQGGGAGQASGISRSFMIVNEVVALQNTTNITNCQAVQDQLNFTRAFQVDCNTSITGADLIIGDDLIVGGDMKLRDDTGEEKFLTRTLEIIDDLFENTVLNKLNATLIGTNLTILTEEGDLLKVNIEDRETIFDKTMDSININLGTNSSPQFNIVTYQNKDNPVLAVSSTVPSAPHAVVARGLVGNDSVYGAVLGLEGSSDEFINAVYDRFFDQGALYITGFTPSISSVELNFSTGEFTAILNDKEENENFTLTADGYYFILSNGSFVQSKNIDDIVQYGTGGAISNNRYFNVVIGIVQRTRTKSRLIAVISDEPSSEYVNLLDAEIDEFESTNVRPANDFLSKIYIPLVRVVMQRSGGSNTIQALSNGENFFDLRGSIPSISGSPPSPSITNHNDLTNLDFANAGHTGFVSIAGLVNETIIRTNNRSWVADSVQNNTILRNGTDANFSNLKVDNIGEKTAGHNVVYNDRIQVTFTSEPLMILNSTSGVPTILIASNSGGGASVFGTTAGQTRIYYELEGNGLTFSTVSINDMTGTYNPTNSLIQRLKLEEDGILRGTNDMVGFTGLDMDGDKASSLLDIYNSGDNNNRLVARFQGGVDIPSGDWNIIDFRNGIGGGLGFLEHDTGGNLQFEDISDEGLKKDFSNYTDDNILNKFNNLQIQNYKYKGSEEVMTGFTAQNMNNSFPELVGEKNYEKIEIDLTKGEELDYVTQILINEGSALILSNTFENRDVEIIKYDKFGIDYEIIESHQFQTIEKEWLGIGSNMNVQLVMAIQELNKENNELEQRIERLETAVCSIQIFGWCLL